MRSIELFTTDCPKCRLLKTMLVKRNMGFTEVTDIEAMTQMGLQTVPWLRVNGEMLDFERAVTWINEQN